MDDAAALVAIVGSGDVTPIHLIICEKNCIRVSHTIAIEHSRVYAGLPRVFFASNATRWLVDASLLKSRAQTRIPCIHVHSIDYDFSKLTEPRKTANRAV